MKKSEFSKLFHELEATICEGVINIDKSKNTRIVYWVFAEQDIMASGEGYENRQTYQVSIYSPYPQCPVYQELRKKLREQGIYPLFNHEYVENDPVFSKNWHTYFAMDVIEDG